MVIALVLGCALAGPFGLLMLALLVSLGGAFEFMRTGAAVGAKPVVELLLLAGIGLPVAAWYFGNDPLIFFALAGALIWLATMLTGVVLLSQEPNRQTATRLAFGPLFIVWAPFGIAHLQLLYAAASQTSPLVSGADPALKTIVLLFVTLWVSDSFAFLFGSKFGKRKLIPHISPGKSWFGLLAGMLGAMVVAAAGTYGLGGNLNTGLIFGALIAVLAPLGDLFKSLLKRSLGVKDFGSLIPGHGGLLDRFDVVLFVAPAIYWLLFNPLG